MTDRDLTSVVNHYAHQLRNTTVQIDGTGGPWGFELTVTNQATGYRSSPIRIDRYDNDLDGFKERMEREVNNARFSQDIRVDTSRLGLAQVGMDFGMISQAFGIDPALLGFSHSSMRLKSYSGSNDGGVKDVLLYDLRDVFDDQPKRPLERVTAAQIHAELYALADADLQEPQLVDLVEPVASERVKTLLNMGFINQPDVVDFDTKLSAYKSLKFDQDQKAEKFALLTKKAMRYPAHKFITHETLTTIVAKYDLRVDTTAEFIGSIPDKNVEEMARFAQQVTIHPEDDAVVGGYLIAAPADQFKPLKQIPFTSVSVPRWLLDDPIVLKPIRDGFLIVTAWGDEAKDPDVLNEKLN